MENKYHHKLRLPVKFIPKMLSFDDTSHFAHLKYDVRDINKDLLNFLEDLGVHVIGAEVFGRTPYTTNPIHVDGNKLSNNVKINFVYGQGLMNWFHLRPTRKVIQKTNTVGMYHLEAEESDCEKVWSASIDDNGSLVNVGILHNLSDITTDRWCYCLLLGDIRYRNTRLQWDRAIELFKDYY